MSVPSFQEGSREVKATAKQRRRMSAQAALNMALTTSFEIKFGWCYLFVNFECVQFLLQFNISSSPQATRQHTSLSAHSPQLLHGSLRRPSPIQLGHQVPSADHARNSTSSRHPPQTRESVTPWTLKPLLDRPHLRNASPTAVRPHRLA